MPGKSSAENQPHRFIGLMSGTSLDGVDAVLADFSQHPPRLLESHYLPYPVDLKDRLARLCATAQVDMLELGQLDVELAHFYSAAVLQLLEKCNLKADQVDAIGCHGQTIRHAPRVRFPFTTQIGDPSTLVEQTGICVVAQFRQRDMAAGGQGAPLVPAFHRFLFGDAQETRVVLNLGGIANISWLPPDETRLIGFDTGPANVLMDGWCQRHRNVPYDHGGTLASQGCIVPALLTALQQHPFFAQRPPKSTGREEFHLEWVDEVMRQQGQEPSFEDVLRTLLELTAWSVAQAISGMGEPADRLIACGGGAYNPLLLQRLAHYLPATVVESCQEHGIRPEHMEALAFAWLARQALLGKPGNHPGVTGARGFRVLGGIYPA